MFDPPHTISHPMSSMFDVVSTLLEERGGAAYLGEPVTQKEHALQCAWLADQEGAEDALVIAALLHDVGHLLHGLGENVADEGTDARHEAAGEQWLARFFGPRVTEPVKLHVTAKRYLCAIDPVYAATLSQASKQSLALQGGPLTADGIAEFADLRYAQDAIRLRRWDDRAKTPGLVTPELTHYALRLEALSATSKHLDIFEH
jgi:phosphonate degradation associated HDIG domain protein